MRVFTASLATETNTFAPLFVDRSAFESAFYCPPGMHPETPTLCVGQPAALDPSRCPEGKAILWIQVPDAPRAIKGDAAGTIPTQGTWDEATREAFADRTYEDDGTLTPRTVAGSVIHDPDLAAARVVRMVLDGAVESRHGTRLPIVADTICVHGDTPTAVAMAATVRRALEEAGVVVRAVGSV